MRRLLNGAKRFVCDDEAATMVEYGILVVLISVVAIVAIAAIGVAINSGFTSVKGELEKVAPPAGS